MGNKLTAPKSSDKLVNIVGRFAVIGVIAFTLIVIGLAWTMDGRLLCMVPIIAITALVVRNRKLMFRRIGSVDTPKGVGSR